MFFFPSFFCFYFQFFRIISEKDGLNESVIGSRRKREEEDDEDKGKRMAKQKRKKHFSRADRILRGSELGLCVCVGYFRAR